MTTEHDGSTPPMSVARPQAAMRPVLLCHDGSERAERAVQRAATLLRPKPAVLLRVPQRPFTGNARHGRIAATILEEARSCDASVIVVGAHGRVSSALVDHADRPVLVGSPAASPSPANEPILLCYDGSRVARQSFAAAGDLLAGRAAIVAAFMPAVDDLAVLRSSLPWPASAEIQDGLARLDRQEAEAPGERAAEGARAAAAAGFVARPLAVGGMDASSEEEEEPSRRLGRAAADEKVACIVVGHRPSAKGLVSTAHGILRDADRPVLVVPGAP
jgi:nucleotide-binding universal stress UspA family protein